jgi:aquaporin Z
MSTDQIPVGDENGISSQEQGWEVPWRLLVSEMIGTGLLLLGGLSFVIFMFGEGSPMPRLIPSVVLRQIITSFLFGGLGATIALSAVGKISGAHINPAVTFGFWMLKKMDGKTAVSYAVAQLIGAFLGCIPLLLWGAMGRSINFGATVPGKGYTLQQAMMGEVATTFGLVAGLCVFLSFRRLRRFTPFMVPFLYAIMVPLESAISGTSTNPARTFGPAIISGRWEGWWIYWLGPLIGSTIAIVVCSRLARRIEVAKLYYFDHESDRRRLFHRMAGSR